MFEVLVLYTKRERDGSSHYPCNIYERFISYLGSLRGIGSVWVVEDILKRGLKRSVLCWAYGDPLNLSEILGRLGTKVNWRLD